MENRRLNPDTKDESPVEAGHVRNANSRTIFKNRELTCQFLRDYSNIPMFADVKPEDIEDVTDRYRAYLGIEFEMDTVKKVRVTIRGKQQEVYVLPLIEHKSYVDYDVAMQILRYMSVIWYTYAKQQNAVRRNISHTEQFRYPLIVPIVYYEGKPPWTADFHLKDRIENAQELEGYVPDFRYHLVNCGDYTKEELENRHDEMSLVMLMNQIQNPGDYSSFFKGSKDYAISVYNSAPDDIRQIYTDIVWSLLMKMKVPVEEAQRMIEELEAGGMGYLFENAEEMDIQAERKKTKEAVEKFQAERKKNAVTEQKLMNTEEELTDTKVELTDTKAELTDTKKKLSAAELRNQMLEKYFDQVIADRVRQCREAGQTKEEVQRSLQEEYNLTEAEASEKAEKHWK